MNTKSSHQEYEPINLDLEIALTKIARALFDYTKSQDDYTELGRLNPIFDSFVDAANDYCNRTNSLHPDLGLELSEWATFKCELYSPDHPQKVKEGRSTLTKESVDAYGKAPEDIIRELESKLGLTE